MAGSNYKKRKGHGAKDKRADNKEGFWDRRERWSQERKRRRADEDGNTAPPAFSAEEIAAEERRPKRKVAVQIGYAGTGYRGMQINPQERTIEGDLFAAFVAAGAISKANADDPRKSSLVRCARTDKGVHAAGNMISLKLIIEDEDLVEKINGHLPPQIRVWGIQQTNNKFSCYQACDSRWYEYLMPSHCLLPPHPDSFVGKKVVEQAKEKGVYDEWKARLQDVEGFWEKVEEEEIKPILATLDDDTRLKVLQQLHASEELVEETNTEPKTKPRSDAKEEQNDVDATQHQPQVEEATKAETPDQKQDGQQEAATEDAPKTEESSAPKPRKPRELSPEEAAIKQIKSAYAAAKRRYRVTPERLGQLQAALGQYQGTHNYHNYTVQKSFKDPSARRFIKSFAADPAPIRIHDTEWLSLKVHGQSFMMHQIRKMVAMATLVVRCGAPVARVAESRAERRISIPKAPGLGLLLDRPVFESYNAVAGDKFRKEPLDFGRFEAAIEAFKQREIYARIWDVEERDHVFHTFFKQIDNFRTDYFLWVTAGGLDAAHERLDRGDKVPSGLEEELGDDGENPDEGEG